MRGSFEGKVVIISGSSMGIGKEVAKQLGTQGAKLVINARNSERLYITQHELRESGYDVIAVAGDVSLEQDCRNLIDSAIRQFGKLDILINNAGLSMRGRVEDLSLDVISLIYKVNVIGPVILSKLALPHLKQSEGSLVFISSLAGLKGLPMISVYSSAKMALTAITESIRIEHAADKLHVGIVYVGYTEIKAGKVAIGSEGQEVNLEERKKFYAMGTQAVARRIVWNIQNRKNKTIVGTIGKSYYLLTRLFPRLMEFATLHSYKNMEDAYK